MKNQVWRKGSFDVAEALWLLQGCEDLGPVLDVAHLVLNLGAVDVVQGVLSQEIGVYYPHHLTIIFVQPDQLEAADRVDLALLLAAHELEKLVDLAVLQLEPFFGEHFLYQQGVLEDEGKHRLDVVLGDVLGLISGAVLLAAVFLSWGGEAGKGLLFIARIHDALNVNAVVAASHLLRAASALAGAFFLYRDCFSVLLAFRIIDDKLAV